ncbi:MAG: transcription antitermination factor NusB [Euzebya sp.]
MTDGDMAAPADDAQGVASRLTAVMALLQIHQQAAWASPVLDRVLTAGDLDARDRSFTANLVFSTLRFEGTLDWILSQLVSRGLEQVESELLDLLRLGTWELRYGGTPTHAAVNAWVEVARQIVGQRATGFVNGVLRNVARRAEQLPWPDPTTDEGMGLQLGYPAWLVSSARQRFGDQRLHAVLEAGNIPAPLVLRAVAPREQVISALAADGIESQEGKLSRHAVVLTQRHVPSDLGVIRRGEAVVQDQSSQVISLAAADGLPAGASAIDLCAAPGGKATHLAQLGLKVMAVDRHAGRLRRSAEMAQRLGLPLDTLVADGTQTGLPAGQADLVLVDAPCSGLGVVRRRPELRWRKTPQDISAMGQVQRALVDAAVSLVRPGGRVAYSVCTWTTQETDLVITDVLAGGRVSLLPSPDLGSPTATGMQLSPDRHEGDGMFLAMIKRKEVSADGW